MKQINSLFLDELLVSCFHDKDICETLIAHLGYEYVPAELPAYKNALKMIVEYYQVHNKLPTIGIISMNNDKEDVDLLLHKLEKVNMPDREPLLVQFEIFLKQAKFQKLYDQTAEIYNKNNHKEAIAYMAEESKKILDFSIYGKTNYFETVFEGFEKRQERRNADTLLGIDGSRKIPFGIDALDSITKGGIDASLGETALFMARSGMGKSTFLRHCAISAARRGFKVLHIQAEGSRQECLDAYDSGWTGIGEEILKKKWVKGDEEKPEKEEKADAKLLQLIKAAIKNIKRKQSDIHVKAFEQFNTATYADVRKCIMDYIKIHGCPPDLLIIDYTELLDSGDGKRYGGSNDSEKMRREAGVKKFKNICIEFRCAGITASQACDIEQRHWNSSSWVMTRNNIAGAKGLIDPFSFFFTCNITNDEYKAKTCRLFIDKARKYPSGQTIHLATNYESSRFYDRVKTMELFGLEGNPQNHDRSNNQKTEENEC